MIGYVILFAVVVYNGFIGKFVYSGHALCVGYTSPQVYKQQELSFELSPGEINLPPKHMIKLVTLACIIVSPWDFGTDPARRILQDLCFAYLRMWQAWRIFLWIDVVSMEFKIQSCYFFDVPCHPADRGHIPICMHVNRSRLVGFQRLWDFLLRSHAHTSTALLQSSCWRSTHVVQLKHRNCISCASNGRVVSPRDSSQHTLEHG